jgi:signal transduction histidine kinase
MSLRLRLIVSFFVVLAVTLGVMVLAFVLFLPTRPAPPQPTYQRLATVAQSVDLSILVREVSGILNPTRRRTALEGALSQLATERNVRVLLVNLADKTVTYDSAGAFQRDQVVDINADVYTLPAVFRRGLFTQVEALFGSMTDVDEGIWLFVAIEAVRSGIATEALVFAEQQRVQSLQEAVADYTGALLFVLIQAGVVGVIVAVLLAGFISRTIARPLQSVAQAAAGMATGNYAERVPITGPQEVRAVAEAFNHMSEQVQGAQQIQQDFLANVSHDLKTPLTSIQGYSQAIMDGAAKDPVSAARIIHEEAGRLNRMVVGLTDLARLQSGRLAMQWSPLDIGNLTEAIAERLAIVAQEKGVQLQVQTQRLPEIVGDGDRLAQVLTNLISNAIKFTSAGGQVRVRTAVSAGGVIVSVQDDGIGIPEKDLARIFERFYQVDKARGPQRGTGLGLAIVAEIVQAHGGRISAESAGEGKGSTFTVWLPSPQMSTVLRKR